MMKPKKIVLITVLLLLIGISLGFAWSESEEDKPNLTIRIQTDKSIYQKDEVVDVILTMENTSIGDLCFGMIGMNSETSWDIGKISRNLRITPVWGRGRERPGEIIYNLEVDEPKPPPIIVVNGEFLYVTPIAKLKPKDKMTISLPNILEPYTLPGPGRYAVIFCPSTDTYEPSSVIEDSGKRYGIIGKAKWIGTLESNTVYFDIVESK